MTIKRGEIHLVALDPTTGHEISKTRPGVIISNDVGNQYSGTVTILPVTSKNVNKIYPFEVMLKRGAANLPRKSKVKTDQIRTIDKRRLVKKLGKLEEKDLVSVEKALKIHLGIGKFELKETIS